MRITENDIAILIPVYQAKEEELTKLFNQLSQSKKTLSIFFVYEDKSCNFDFCAKINDLSTYHNIKYKIMVFDGQKGLGYALHHGLRNITQDYILRHDIGDDILENRIPDVLLQLNKKPNIDILYSQALLSNQENEIISTYPITLNSIIRYFAKGNPICHPTVVLKRSSIMAIGNYNPELRYCEDMDLWLRAIKEKLHFACINKPTIRYFLPNEGRNFTNWKVNLSVRLKNFGSPNLIISLIGIINILIYTHLPENVRKMVYAIAKK